MIKLEGLHDPVLQWAIVDDCLQPVSTFSHLPPAKRPSALCPVCKQPVILKLGPERAHHIAHHEGDICIATQPETILHLNAKYHLQNHLRIVHILSITQSCSTMYCTNEHAVEFARDWDRVETEWSFGPYRLDVALLRQGQVVGAIEVQVFHPCEPDKIDYLNQQNVPWLEIQVTPEFYTQPGAWQPSQPLASKQYNSRLVQPWECDACRDVRERADRAQEELERKRAYAAQFKVLATRYVDFYFPSGKKYRKIYLIETKINQENGEVFFTQLQEIAPQRRIIATLPSTFPGGALKTLKSRLKDELIAIKKNNQGWLVDNSRDWMKAPSNFYPLMYLNESRYPYRYYTWDGKNWKNGFEELRKKMQIAVTDSPKVVQPTHPLDSHPPVAPVEQQPFDGEYTCMQCGKKTNDWTTRFDSKTCLCRDCSNTNTGRAEKQNVGEE
jgi:hypothetical protein